MGGEAGPHDLCIPLLLVSLFCFWAFNTCQLWECQRAVVFLLLLFLPFPVTSLLCSLFFDTKSLLASFFHLSIGCCWQGPPATEAAFFFPFNKFLICSTGSGGLFSDSGASLLALLFQVRWLQ